MKIPAIQYSHKTGITSTDCPVTITYEVSTDNATWVSTGTDYTDLISTTSTGALTIIPATATFGAGSDTASINRYVRVKYSNANSPTSNVITDSFTVKVYSTAAIAKLANDQPDTLTLNSHGNVFYTVGDADLSVASTSITVKKPTDPLGFNDFTTVSAPGLTYKLEFLSGSTWTAITTAND